MRARAAALALALACSAACSVAVAQQSPVYPDDSVQARESLIRVDELQAAGNLAEAARVLQTLLDTEGDKVLESGTDADLFISVRERVHRLLLAKPALLERYRTSEGPRAAKLLDENKHEQVEATRLLTPAGFEAALRVAQLHLEAGRFEAARLTLEQLEKHPERRGKPGADAATLATRVARFIARPEAVAWADRWRQESAVPGGGAKPLEIPAELRTPSTSPQTEGSAPDWASLPAKPLISTVVVSRPNRETDDELSDEDPMEFASQGIARPWILPGVSGDTVVVNNATHITGLDRFTLAPLWTIRPSGRDVARQSSTRGNPPLSRLEDPAWVHLSGPIGLAATGFVTESGREGDRRLHAFEVRSGRVLWSLDPAAIDRRLEGYSVRGEPSIVEGTAVIPMRRNSSIRRISGVLFAGLDAWTGELRWIRPVCSVGVLPYNRSPHVAERCVAANGIVYKSDSLGVVSALEAASGRVVWIRRMPVQPEARAMASISQPGYPQAWASTNAIVDGTSLITLAPDFSAILRLSALDGSLLGRRGVDDLGEDAALPLYLLRAGDRLIAVAQDRMISLRLADFERDTPKVSTLMRDPGVAGRISVAGSSLLVPLENKVLEFNAADLKVAASHDLAAAGNLIALSDSLLVAGSGEVHAFLKWETAESILTQRMTKSPDDTGPALSMANLAFRSGRYTRIAPAIDRVLEIRDRLPDAAPVQAARRRLVDSLRAMLASGKQRWDPGTDARSDKAESPPLPVLNELSQRFARAAESPAELAEHELVAGWLGEAKAAPGESLEAYARVLADASLAESMVQNELGVPVSASQMATERLLALVRRVGPSVYEPFAMQAARELEELGPEAKPIELLALATRFPASTAAAAAWIRVADAHAKSKNPAAESRCLSLALRALEHAQSPRTPQAVADAKSVASRLIAALSVQNRLSEAARTAAAFPSRFAGATVEPPAKRSDPARGLQARPQLGRELSDDVRSLVGWVIAPAKITDNPGRPTDRAVLVSPGRRQVALFATSLTDSSVEPMWTRRYEQRSPRVIRIDADSTYLYWPAESRADRTGGVIERVRNDGSSAWVSREITQQLDEIEARDAEESTPFSTPLDGSVSPGDLLVAMDDSTLILLERVGRVIAIDLAAGKSMWTARLPKTRIYDAAICGGTLVIGGASTDRDAAVAFRGRSAFLPMILVALDAKRGGALRDLRPALARGLNLADDKNLAAALGEFQQVRWLRTISAGRVLMGMHSRVVAFDAAGESVLWNYDKPIVTRSVECWVQGDRAYVLNEDRGVVTLNLGDGSAPHEPLDAGERLSSDGPIAVAPLPDGAIGFVGGRGLAVFSAKGELIGRDASVHARENGNHFAVGENVVAMVPDQSPEPDGTVQMDLRVLALPSGKLVSTRSIALGRPPGTMISLDGRLLLTAGGVTLVLPLPTGRDSLVPTPTAP
ncbi:MAG: PQQ-binding-like beta-propeller repeat protein [Phycisphaerales bacterium]|nr:PQQ-binding-like beta-propeller repeat protein [Phycisphaerales bacterium]